MFKKTGLLSSLLLSLLVLLLCCASALADDTLITLSDSGILCDAPGVQVDGTTILISAPGTYRLTGTLTNGQVKVDCKDKGEVTLILDGVRIHHARGPAIEADQVKPRLRLTLAEGTETILSGGSAYDTNKDKEPNGVIFSRSDLLLDGSGSLRITAACYDGIVSKDDLMLSGITLTVDAARHGLRGKDSLTLTGCTIDITCGKDALRSTNDEKADRGTVTAQDCVLQITCGDDPIDAVHGYALSETTLTAVIEGN